MSGLERGVRKEREEGKERENQSEVLEEKGSNGQSSEDRVVTYDGLGRLVGIDAGVCSNPIAETLFRRFLSAAKAEDCGRSIRRP